MSQHSSENFDRGIEKCNTGLKPVGSSEYFILIVTNIQLVTINSIIFQYHVVMGCSAIKLFRYFLIGGKNYSGCVQLVLKNFFWRFVKKIIIIKHIIPTLFELL